MQATVILVTFSVTPLINATTFLCTRGSFFVLIVNIRTISAGKRVTVAEQYNTWTADILFTHNCNRRFVGDAFYTQNHTAHNNQARMTAAAAAAQQQQLQPAAAAAQAVDVTSSSSSIRDAQVYTCKR